MRIGLQAWGSEDDILSKEALNANSDCQEKEGYEIGAAVDRCSDAEPRARGANLSQGLSRFVVRQPVRRADVPGRNGFYRRQDDGADDLRITEDVQCSWGERSLRANFHQTSVHSRERRSQSEPWVGTGHSR